MHGSGVATVKRLVFYRPHLDIWFKNPLKTLLTRHRLPHKYEPMLDWLLASGMRIAFSTSFVRRPGVTGLLRYLAEPVELVLWCLFNRIKLSRVERVTTPRSLTANDLLFIMHYGNLTHEVEALALAGRAVARALSAVNAAKVVHLTHFAYQPSIGAENLAALRPDLVVAENNLGRNSGFFKTFFADVRGRSGCLPYTVAPRFVRRRSFGSRQNKLVATGSITFRMNSREFNSYFSTDELSPLRRELFAAADRFTAEMDCLISDLDGTRRTGQAALSSRLLRKVARLIKGGHPQQSYYRRDIVATYNSYTMFAVPEEVCDLPAIGFVEGMACGCAYFGRDDPMYRDIGMLPDVHYVGYDGSMADLIEKVRYFQQPNHAARLEQIANKGHAFVTSNLTPDVVYGAFKSGELMRRATLLDA